MKYSIKAALSSVALPGAGLIILRHYFSGLFFLLPYLTAVAYIVQLYFNRTLNVVEDFAMGRLPPELGVLFTEIFHVTDLESLRWLAISKWAYLLSCVLSILVSGIAGHLRDKQESNKPQTA